MPDLKSKRFIYKNSVKWQGQKKGFLMSSDKPGIEVSTPPEFKGYAGAWSPEDLFTASVNICIMTTFLFFAEREGIEFSSYESGAEGVLEKIEGKFIFSEIIIRPKIRIKEKEDVNKIREIIALSEKSCLISNSIKSRVEIIPEIE